MLPMILYICPGPLRTLAFVFVVIAGVQASVATGVGVVVGVGVPVTGAIPVNVGVGVSVSFPDGCSVAGAPAGRLQAMIASQSAIREGSARFFLMALLVAHKRCKDYLIKTPFNQ
jgi:hypothetical protein